MYCWYRCRMHLDTDTGGGVPNRYASAQHAPYRGKWSVRSPGPAPPRPGVRRRYGSDIYTPTETFLMSPPTCTLVVAHSWQKKNTSDSPCRLPSLSTWLVGTWQTVYLRSLPPSLLCWHVAASTSTSRARSGQSRALSLNATQRSAPWIDEQYWPRTPTVLALCFHSLPGKTMTQPPVTANPNPLPPTPCRLTNAGGGGSPARPFA